MLTDLEPIPTYRLARDPESDKRPGMDRATLSKALAWWPPCRDLDDGEQKGPRAISAMRSLEDGDAISIERIELIRWYCAEAISYYGENPWGDSQMKDLVPQAVADFERVLELLS